MNTLGIFWKGRIPIENVSWEYFPELEVKLSENLERMKEDIWEQTLVKDPNAYDGRCLVLNSFNVKGNHAVLRLGFIRYSRIMVLESIGKAMDGYGSLGFQALIFSPDKKQILFGTRASNLMYCPLFHSPIGGMLEEKDVVGTVDAACMREITEEAQIELDSKRDLVAIVAELHADIGVGLIIEGTARDIPELGTSVKGNEEWENGQLRWHPVDILEQLEESNSLDGLVFAKNEWKIYKETGDSVFW
ncbi:MAG: hypothetical protein ACTSQZ_06985 [Candidatus Thorarchaeota archaeon]